MERKIKILEGEYWWGGSSALADPMPLSNKTELYTLDMYFGFNQTMPLYVSSLGRYIWSDKPMSVCVKDGEFTISSSAEILLSKAGETLKDAYLAASKTHFPFTGKVPPLKFFETAQYNTWMEMVYDQNQSGVLSYARSLIDHGYEPGVLMIDEGWHTRYGLWEFDKYKFPDPKAMVDELHAMGFKVMLWVTPLHTADGKEFIFAADPDQLNLVGCEGSKKHFLRTDEGNVAIVKWWNGYSAILNLCRNEDREYLDTKLRKLIDEYGIDGFKFDGGINRMYNPKNVLNGKQTAYEADELNIAWNEFGSRYEYHEYKDTYKGGGKGTISRLQDRLHSWSGNGIDSIMPAALLQGLLGHPFICPDMVGGGSFGDLYKENFKHDGELFARMAQVSALFPMIQFSLSPWKVLDEEHQGYCLAAAKLHKSYGEYIVTLVRESAVSGEPIVRHMEYEYPHSGYQNINDQFLLGRDILVAPVIVKGQKKRTVVLPEGKWSYRGEIEYDGGQTVVVDAPVDVLPYFLRCKE